MSVSFNLIPADLRVPLFYAELDNSAANKATASIRALLIGQRLSAGAVSAGVPTRIAGEADGILAFGKGSHLARMIKAFRAQDPIGELWAVAVDDDGGGAAASGTITITGPATGPGTIYLYIAGQLVKVKVSYNDSANTIAAAVNTAINAAGDLPVTSGVVNAVCTLTARNKGTLGNKIDVRINYGGAFAGEILPTGVGVTITALANGATDPSLTSALASIADLAFEVIGIPYSGTTELNALKVELSDSTGRWSPLKAQFGHAITAKPDTQGNLSSFGAARNNQHETVYGYNKSPTPPYEWAGALAGATFASIRNDPARPLQTLALAGVLAPALGDRFSLTERSLLLVDGIATVSYDADGTTRIERSITTYQTNPAGADDDSYLDSETLFTLAYILRALRSRIVSKYPRHKLVNDGTRYGAGQAVVTPKVIKAEIVGLYRELEQLALVENGDLFKAALVVERNAQNPNRVDVLFPPDLANQLRIFAVLAQFRLQF